MAFKTIKINERDPKDFDNRLIFDLKVNISQDGMFTAYLPDNVIELFKESSIELKQNPRRRSKEGFYDADTLNGITEQIRTDISEYFSRELIESKIVIKYNIRTTCAYSINAKEEIVPNCGSWDWGEDDENLDWRTGSVDQDCAHSKPYGILVYARPFERKAYRYKSGLEKIEYAGYYTNGHSFEDGKYLYHLASFCSMSVPGDKFGYNHTEKLDELDYTEDTAQFFVELLTSICRLNENIKDLLDPKSILKVIENKQKLLG